MRVLVTGGAGFIGANLVRLLTAEGHVVTVLDNLSVGRAANLANVRADLVNVDILHRGAVEEAVTGHDAIVHLAAQTGVPRSLADPLRDCYINVLGTLNVLEAARKATVRRVVFASSNAPLGRQTPPATEDKAPLPVSPYGASKLAGEGYCLAYHGSWGLETIVLRFANVYGPFSWHKESVIAAFMKAAQARHGLRIDGDGSQTRDFIYTGDLCRAISLALSAGSTVAGEVFQIATGVETSITRLAALINRIANDNTQLRHGPARRGDVKRNHSEIHKALQMLSWQPTVSLWEGLGRTWAWFSHCAKFEAE